MSTCKYHPLKPALYFCRHCNSHICDYCCDENPTATEEDGRRCFICSKPVQFLGAAHSVEPFWRRLDKIYRYGFTSQALTAIVVCSFLTLLSLYNPWLILIPTILLTRYSFNCLSETANGNMKAPTLYDSFNGGIQLMLQLIGIVLIAGGLVTLASMFLGGEVGALVGLLVIFLLPAIFILLAINGTLSEAINPSNIGRLIAAAGAPYIIMLLFIFVMMASIGLINTMIGDGHRAMQFIAQNLVSNYYTVVIFHLMGYLVFQKQDAFGYYAADSDYAREPRSQTEIELAHIEVLVKEGYYQHALEMYRELLPKHFNNLALWEKCLKLMCQVGEPTQVAKFADQFLPRLLSRDDEFAVAKVYREILEAARGYQPRQSDLAIRLGQILFNMGDHREVARLLNNFHKRHQDKREIYDAYNLLANSLDRIPTMEKKANSYRVFLESLQGQMDKEREKELRDNPLAKFTKRV